MKKTKTTSLTKLIKQGNFYYVNSNITLETFPPESIRSEEYKLFHFNRYISSDDAVKEMEKEGYAPANIYELLSWKGWNGTDWVVGFGSEASVIGGRGIPYLIGSGSGRDLSLSWRDGGWSAVCRFLAVRTSSLETKAL